VYIRGSNHPNTTPFRACFYSSIWVRSVSIVMVIADIILGCPVRSVAYRFKLIMYIQGAIDFEELTSVY
jgi:hypothetical protein